MQVKGKVVQVNQVQTFGSNGFKKATIWVETDDQYPQTIEVEFVKEKADEIQEIEKDQTITIDVNLRGRAWTNPQGETKVFNTVQGYKYEVSSDF